MSRGARVLVIDDNDDDIELLRLTFARVAPACSVMGASSRPAALAVLGDDGRRPDLVLLDWKLPGIDCPDLLRSLRSDPRTVGLAVVVFSSSDDPADVRTAYHAGATAYILKPGSLDEYDAFVHDLAGFWCRATLYP